MSMFVCGDIAKTLTEMECLAVYMFLYGACSTVILLRLKTLCTYW